jgi:repressor LexA
MMRKPGKRQQQIYEYLQKFQAEHGYPPSVREIGTAVGLKSPSTVHLHLKNLAEAGYILRDEGKTRAICLPGKNRQVPILGRVAAGNPILAYEDYIGTLPFDPGDAGEFFALEVRGDSMKDAGILAGDYVVVRRQETATSGEIVVALLDDEATVKRFQRRGRDIWLLPENRQYDPINGNNCIILGRVTTVIREL